MSCWWCGGGQGSFYSTSPNKVFPFIGAFYTLTITKVVPKLQRVISLLAAQKENSRNSCSSCQQMLHLLQERDICVKKVMRFCGTDIPLLWWVSVCATCMGRLHTVRFYRKSRLFGPAFRIEIDESFSRFFSLTLVLVDSILLLDV